jgi:hypothetical protein
VERLFRKPCAMSELQIHPLGPAVHFKLVSEVQYGVGTERKGPTKILSRLSFQRLDVPEGRS